LRAAGCRDVADRRRAAVRACRESALREAALRPWRFNARDVARERAAEGRPRRRRLARLADAALRFVLGLAFLGGRSFTPERRAFDSPIAIACFVDAAPCFPSRMWCISSRTNSPAWVLGAFPCRLSRRARLSVSFSGIDASAWLTCIRRSRNPWSQQKCRVTLANRHFCPPHSQAGSIARVGPKNGVW
jgi:hypothetical protein